MENMQSTIKNLVASEVEKVKKRMHDPREKNESHEIVIFTIHF
jgi:hypothetical protein